MPPLLVALLAVASAGILAANLLASRRILRDDLVTPAQRAAQFLFVWLVPIVGAIFMFLLTRSNLEAGSGRYSEEKETQDEEVAVAKVDYGSPD